MDPAIPQERALMNATQLSNSIAAVLSTAGPPFLTPHFLAQENGLATISLLIDPASLVESNGKDLWSALDDHVVASDTEIVPEIILSLASVTLESLLSTPIFDDGSISLSCTLFPTSSDDVTLTPYSIQLVTLPASARTSILALDDDELHTSAWWNLPEWMRKKKPAIEEPEKTIIVAKKIFIIPTDRISISAQWWGYSIYLPHSVMLKLQENVDPTLESISSISKALTFIIANIPDAFVGLPGVALLKALAPIVALIASFLAWSWKGIKNDNKGNGVILSATWLLPIAIVPRTWKIAPIVAPVEGAAPAVPVVVKGEEATVSSGTKFLEYFETVKETDRREFIRRSSQEQGVGTVEEGEEQATAANLDVDESHLDSPSSATTTIEHPTIIDTPSAAPPTLHVTAPSEVLPSPALPAAESPPPMSPTSATSAASAPSESSRKSAKLTKKKVTSKVKNFLHFGREQSDSVEK